MREIKDLDQAAEAMRRVGQIYCDVADIEAAMNQAITGIKQRAVKDSGPLLKERTAIESALQKYLDAQQKALDGRKSVQTLYGSFGRRFSQRVARVRGWSEQRVIEALGYDVWGKVFLRREVKLTVNRDAVLDIPAGLRERLQPFGLRIAGQDRFFAEPDLERIRKEPRR